MRAPCFAIMALMLCLAPNSGAAEPQIAKTYSYFTISGKTGADLEQEFSRLGPMLSGKGTRHAGATRIKLGGSVNYENSGSKCRITEAVVKLETHLTLPRWKDRKRANPDMVLIWDTLFSDIKRHEERHAEIARQYARKLEKSLEALRPERTCAKMQARVDATTTKIIEKHAADQDRFDRVEAASFQRRMTRMLGFRLDKRRNGG